MKDNTKLIVLRGPSGAGKSTVAKMLHDKAVRKTAIFDQDYYRHVMFNNLHSDLEAPRYVMFAGVLTALERGYDVIIEGFMGMGKYKVYFDELISKHPNSNYFFYLDVSFEETLRRHSTRQKAETLTDAKMYELYLKSGPTGYPSEQIVAESMSAEQALSLIIDTTQLLN